MSQKRTGSVTRFTGKRIVVDFIALEDALRRGTLSAQDREIVQETFPNIVAAIEDRIEALRHSEEEATLP